MGNGFEQDLWRKVVRFLVSADYAQFELRLAAALAGDQKLIGIICAKY